MSGANRVQNPNNTHTTRIKGAVNPGSDCSTLKSRAIQVEIHDAITINIKALMVKCIKTPTAIPTNVPLKPYNPFFISSRPYPDKQAVSVLIIFPLMANTPICHEFKNIPTSINKPDRALFWNITCPIPRPKMSNELYIDVAFINCKSKKRDKNKKIRFVFRENDS